jgi:protease-4
MAFSTLYYTLLNKPFFIDVRRIEAQAVLIDKFLEHDIVGMNGSTLSERTPIPKVLAAPDQGRTGVLAGSPGETTGDFANAPKDSVAVVSLRGDMLKEGTMCSYGTEEIAAVLREAADARNIIGTRLDIDSGGGAVDAIAPMLEAIAYTQSKDKPVVASCDLCASAAYYVACHCNSIVADNSLSAEFGSIGVMMQFPDYAKYYEQKGIKIHTIYSNLSEWKNAPFEAARRGDYASIKAEQLDPLARQFQEAVKAHRQQLDLTVDGILNGRMFYAADALKHGLIDQVGTAAEATELVRRLSADMRIRRLL